MRCRRRGARAPHPEDHHEPHQDVQHVSAGWPRRAGLRRGRCRGRVPVDRDGQRQPRSHRGQPHDTAHPYDGECRPDDGPAPAAQGRHRDDHGLDRRSEHRSYHRAAHLHRPGRSHGERRRDLASPRAHRARVLQLRLLADGRHRSRSAGRKHRGRSAGHRRALRRADRSRRRLRVTRAQGRARLRPGRPPLVRRKRRRRIQRLRVRRPIARTGQRAR